MAARNPPWSRDELILALALYFRHSPLHISKTHREVVALSRLLNRLPLQTDRPDAERFRNPNGVYMKMCNFLALDPKYSGTGLSAGGKKDKEVWDDYAEDRARLRRVAEAIRVNGTGPEAAADVSGEDDDYEATEGRLLLGWHKARERNPSLVRRKKAQALKKHGKVRCESCSFVYQEKYGELGKDYIECHHAIPLTQLRPGQKTRLSDLRLVCADCHRMLHRAGESVSVEDLRVVLRDVAMRRGGSDGNGDRPGI